MFTIWNRKGHYYLGLYFLFFLWLFAFTGLLLNHGWKFAEFWPQRQVSKFDRPVTVASVSSDIERARDVMRQLGIRGEVEWIPVRPDSTFSFRVARPGYNAQIALDTAAGLARVEETRVNAWGVMRILHTFSGARVGDTRNRRDWLLTSVWVFAMDAVAAGMVLMALSGIWMWYRLPAKRVPGLVALASGTVVCALFVFGLRWLYS